MSTHPTPAPVRQRTTLLALCFSAGLLGSVLGGALFREPGAAMAQQGEGSVTVVGERARDDSSSGGLISAAEQRKQIINELRTIGARLERVESALAKPLAVRVTNAAELRPAEEPRREVREPAPAPATQPPTR